MDLKTFLAKQANHLLSGDLPAIIDDYVFPLEIHFADESVVVHDKHHFEHMLSVQHEHVKSCGVQALSPVIHDIEWGLQNRLHVSMSWRNQFAVGFHDDRTEYFIFDEGDRFRIAMVDFEFSMPRRYRGALPSTIEQRLAFQA